MMSLVVNGYAVGLYSTSCVQKTFVAHNIFHCWSGRAPKTARPRSIAVSATMVVTPLKIG